MTGPGFWLVLTGGIIIGWAARSALHAWRQLTAPRRPWDQLAARRRHDRGAA